MAHGWRRSGKFSKFVLPDALKILSVALYVLRFCKTFPKLPKFTLQNTLFYIFRIAVQRTVVISFYFPLYFNFSIVFKKFSPTDLLKNLFIGCITKFAKDDKVIGLQ